MKTSALQRLEFYDCQPETASFHDDVINGLKKQPRYIPPKYFYDEVGSRLFDEICETPEYYPTRTEISILKDNLDDIASYIGSDCVLLEPGCGSSRKVRLLLESIRPHIYVPMDISGDYLLNVARQLVNDYPALNVYAACVDYTAPLDIPVLANKMRKVAFFPGSTIGNFEPADAVRFISNIASIVGADGGLLIGVDLKKDIAILNNAYNDKTGVTARFNLNLLQRINTELNADFDLGNFSHRAFYNEDKGRIEMHLVSKKFQKVSVKGEKFSFSAGESIHTENSYKYTINEFQQLAENAGFVPEKVWMDAEQLFSVQYFRIPGSG